MHTVTRFEPTCARVAVSREAFLDELLARIETFAVRSAEALARGCKLVFFGNGGSAADAQHLAAELTVKLRADRPGLAALALTTNTSVLTAAANDLGFERVFERQIESLVSPVISWSHFPPAVPAPIFCAAWMPVLPEVPSASP